MSLRRYFLRQTLFPLLIILYFIIAIFGKPQGNSELFPFFNWSLFSSSSNPRADIVIMVKSINGKPFEKRKYFFEMTRVFEAARSRESRFSKTLDRLAYAHFNSSKDEIRLRKSIESNFMGEVENLEYDLVQIVFDPIDRLSSGRVIKTNTIATYRKGDYVDH